MGIFNKRKQIEQWTEKTAPKKRAISIQIDMSLQLAPESQYGSSLSCLKNAVTKELLVNTDSDKESIKKEVLRKLEFVYEEFCESLDSNTDLFSNTFWENIKLQKQEEV
jgi:hypothetical protein